MRFNPLPFAFLAISVTAGDIAVTVTDQKREPVAELVLWLEPLDAPVPPATAAELSATVEQIDEEFEPYTIAVRLGSLVEFPNRDDVQHHVYSLSTPARFDIPLHGGDETKSVIMDRTGLVPIGCNIHDWMLSHIVVVDTPWFGTTDGTGSLALANLPAGRYKLTAWHPRIRKPDEREITIVDGEATSVALELRLRPDRRIRRAPTSGGSRY
ncbi:MAG: carboxypeptidase regulatory-like domain-containing protein [bacterium]